MEYVFATEYRCDADSAPDPATVNVTVDSSVIAKIPVISDFLKENDVDYAYLRWVGGYTFFDDDGEEFEPEYSVNGVCMRVFPDASFRFVFPFKHTNDEGFTNILELSDAEPLETT